MARIGWWFFIHLQPRLMGKMISSRFKDIRRRYLWTRRVISSFDFKVRQAERRGKLIKIKQLFHRIQFQTSAPQSPV